MKKRIEALLYSMLILVAAISILNVFLIQDRAAEINKASEEAKELLKPAKLEVTKILVSKCEDCFDIEAALESIKKQNVDLTKERTLLLDESEAKELIGKFNIQKIPAMIISGEVNKTSQLKSFFDGVGEFSGQDNQNNVVYTSISPPYYDVPSSKVVGKVSIINVVDSSCKECVPLAQVITSLKQAGVAITKEDSYEYNSKKGADLIEKFNITRIPAMLVSSEINYYSAISEQIKQLTEENSGFYALHATLPPYRDLEQGKVVGMVKLIFLMDGSCTGCYNVEVNERILANLGVFVKESASYDVSSNDGKALISKYSIGKAPIILVSPEASAYPAFVQAWPSVGSLQEDGWYVMRMPERLGAYKDLKTNKIVSAR